MKVWIIFIKVRWNGQLVMRYIDSQWARKEAADDRKKELTAAIEVFGRMAFRNDNGAMINIIEASVADVAITEPRPAKDSDQTTKG